MNNKKNHIKGLTPSWRISLYHSHSLRCYTIEELAMELIRLEHDPLSIEIKRMDIVGSIGDEVVDIPDGPIEGISVLDHDRPIIDLESWRKDHPCKIKLYEAFSMFDNPDYGLILYQWYVDERKDPVVTYDEAIYGHGSLEFQTAYLAFGTELSDPYYAEEFFRYHLDQEFIDECFTKEELEPLKEYLNRTFGIELHSFEVTLPIYKRVPVGDFFDSVAERYYLMYLDEGYSLPFKVSAAYWIPYVAKKDSKNKAV